MRIQLIKTLIYEMGDKKFGIQYIDILTTDYPFGKFYVAFSITLLKLNLQVGSRGK